MENGNPQVATLEVIVNQDWNENSGFEDIEFAHAGAQGAAVEA